MKQTLHIFAKDARRFWPEIAISLAITAGFAWIYPNQWMTPEHYARTFRGGVTAYQQLQMLSAALVVLVPISWWLLIARVVHAESLVGDRQFWLTRPYEWKKLLAAKTLFLLAFLYLPFAAAQLALLWQAGFQPFGYMPGLCFSLFLLSCFLVAPIFALAAVTSNFARLTLTVVGIVLGFVAVGVFASRFSSPSVSTPGGDNWTIPILLAYCIAVVAMQYASRRLWISRVLLVLASLFLSVEMVPPSGGAAVDRAYSVKTGGQEAPFHIALHRDATHQVRRSPQDAGKQVEIQLPFQVSGVADGYAITPDNFKVVIEASNGEQWSSPWQAINAGHYIPGEQESSVGFSMDRSVYERFQSSPVRLHLILALTEAKAAETRRVSMSNADFFVPGFGVCSPESSLSASGGGITGISCRSAYRQPSLTYVETLWSNAPCSSAPTELATGVHGAGWAGDLGKDPAQFGIASVWTINLNISNAVRSIASEDRVERYAPRYLCPGTPISLTRYRLARRLQTEVEVPDFQLQAIANDE